MYFSDKIISEAVKLGGHVLSLNTYTLWRSLWCWGEKSCRSDRSLFLNTLIYYCSYSFLVDLIPLSFLLSERCSQNYWILLKYFLHICTLTWSYFLLRQIHLKSCVSQNWITKWIMETFLGGNCYYFSRISSNTELIHGIDQCSPSV